jgi:hypothetical protein
MKSKTQPTTKPNTKNMKKHQSPKSQSEIIIYQTKDGKNSVEVQLDHQTIWLDAHKIASIFEVDRTVVVKHIQNIFRTEELSKNSTCAIFAQVAADGKKRQMHSYNLDMIIAVGYRVNSKRATQFRIWASGVLKDHLTKGFTINRQRFEENARELEVALELVRKAAKNPDLLDDVGAGLVDVITRYTHTHSNLFAFAALSSRCHSRESGNLE